MRAVLVALVGVALSACTAVSPDLTEGDVASFTGSLAHELKASAEPLSGPLTVDAAVTRALKYNYSVRAKELEVAVAMATVRADGAGMLPKLVAQSEYYRRSRTDAASIGANDSRSTVRDAELTWNILDFGLSYVRSRQGLNKVRQQQEEAHQIKARIIEDTRVLYWQAVAQERLSRSMRSLKGEVETSLAISRKAASDPQIDPMTAINSQRDILTLQRELNLLQASLAGARMQLANVIAAPAAGRLDLAPAGKHRMPGPERTTPADDVSTAMQNRPEIRSIMYEMRITEDEVYAAILRVLPGLSLSRTSGDTNALFMSPSWIGIGTTMSGNLLSLVRLPSDLEAVDASARVQRQRALAIASTIVMQVHVARARAAVLAEAYRDAVRFAESQVQLLHQVNAAVEMGKTGHQALTREKLATVLADVRAILAFAELEGALAACETAKGSIAVGGGSTPLRVAMQAEPPARSGVSSTVASK